MRDDEVEDVVSFLSLRSFRRLYQALPTASLTDAMLSTAAGQATCISLSTSLERLEIILCGYEPFIKRADESTDDPRVVVMGVRRTWLQLLYDEYLVERQRFIGVYVL